MIDNMNDVRFDEAMRFKLKCQIENAMSEHYENIKGIETYKILAQTDKYLANLLETYEAL